MIVKRNKSVCIIFTEEEIKILREIAYCNVSIPKLLFDHNNIKNEDTEKFLKSLTIELKL